MGVGQTKLAKCTTLNPFLSPQLERLVTGKSSERKIAFHLLCQREAAIQPETDRMRPTSVAAAAAKESELEQSEFSHPGSVGPAPAKKGTHETKLLRAHTEKIYKTRPVSAKCSTLFPLALRGESEPIRSVVWFVARTRSNVPSCPSCKRKVYKSSPESGECLKSH